MSKFAIGLIAALMVAAPAALSMTEAQEHNLEAVMSREGNNFPQPNASRPTSPQTVSPSGPYQQYGQQFSRTASSYGQYGGMVPRPTYRPPIYPDYRHSYGNSAYIPLSGPNQSMIYRGGSPNAQVSPLMRVFSNLSQRPGGYGGGMPAAGSMPNSGGMIAPSAVSGTYSLAPNRVPNCGSNVPVEEGGSNPFNLSPFGMLHYMWDDTTYTSPTNPVALYQVQNDLQVAKQQSQLAQSAAARAKYAGTAQERQQAAQQAHYYAQQAQIAAQRARNESLAGSLDPAQLANAAGNEAQQAAAAANKAASFAAGGY